MSAPSTASLKSDHFSLFALPRKLWIEMSTLEKKFLELSWKLHPDKFVNASPEEQETSLKRSSELNDAYRVLRDPVARVEYLLEIEGMRKEGEHKQQAPPELLEEVFELNMQLEEMRMAHQTREEDPALKQILLAPRVVVQEHQLRFLGVGVVNRGVDLRSSKTTPRSQL